MNWSGSAWQASKTPAKLSPTRTRDMTARRSVSELYSPAKKPGLARRVLRCGSRAPHLNPQSHARLQPRRKERQVKGRSLRINDVPFSRVLAVTAWEGPKLRIHRWWTGPTHAEIE